MLQTFVQYAAYNLWANERLTKTLSEVPGEVITSDTHDCFGSVYKTVTHLWDVEEVWWHRLQKKAIGGMAGRCVQRWDEGTARKTFVGVPQMGKLGD